MADPSGNQGQNTQMVSIAQNLVVALNGVANAINTRFPNWVTVPANSTASGVAGQVAYDSTAIYWCYAANSWRKANGTSF